jgi:hypothetical protein
MNRGITKLGVPPTCASHSDQEIGDLTKRYILDSFFTVMPVGLPRKNNVSELPFIILGPVGYPIQSYYSVAPIIFKSVT